jgi:hypothetical protein
LYNIATATQVATARTCSEGEILTTAQRQSMLLRVTHNVHARTHTCTYTHTHTHTHTHIHAHIQIHTRAHNIHTQPKRDGEAYTASVQGLGRAPGQCDGSSARTRGSLACDGGSVTPGPGSDAAPAAGPPVRSDRDANTATCPILLVADGSGDGSYAPGPDHNRQ